MAMNPRLLRPTANDSPASIPGLALWLDAAAADALYQNSDGTVPATAPGDPVGYWRDRSGNGRHATQSTAESRPVVGSQNGRKALTFDGSNDRLGTYTSALQPSSIFAVAKCTSSGAFPSGRTILGSDTSNQPLAWIEAGRWEFVRWGQNMSGPVAADSTINVLSATNDGTTSALFVNGGGNVTDSGGTFSSGALTVGAATDQQFFVGDICELLVYDRELNPAQRRKAEVYLARRWGITLAPQVSNAEAQDWISRVYANGGTVSTSTASAVSTFCDAIESAGIRDRFYRLGIFAGDNLNAALVPLYRGPTFGGTTYGNATDTNNGPFVSGDYSLASGLWPGASNSSKYLNTGYKANTLAASNTHLGLGLLATNTINNSFRTGLGAFSGSSNSLEMILHSTVSGARCASFTRFGTATDTAGDVVFNASLTAGSIVAAWPTVYRDGVATGTDATTSQDYPSAHDMFVFANSSGGVTPINYSNPRLGYYSIGATMTSAQALAYSTAMSAFYSAIGRS